MAREARTSIGTPPWWGLFNAGQGGWFGAHDPLNAAALAIKDAHAVATVGLDDPTVAAMYL